MGKSIEAIIFDLDGTLVDSEWNYYLADKKVFKEYGIDLTFEQKKKYIGTGVKDAIREAFKEFGINDYDLNEVVEKKLETYHDITKENVKIFPNMKDFLMKVSDDYKLALASGSHKETVDIILSAGGLVDYFTVIIGGDEVQRGKPSPDIFLLAAERLCVSPENCLVVEDTVHGAEAAYNANMYCIFVPDLDIRPDYQLHFDTSKCYIAKEGTRNFDSDKAFKYLKSLD